MTGARAAGAVVVLAVVGGGWAAPAHAAPESTTTLVLTRTISAYGDTVRATAQVDAGGALVDGDIYFVVDGTSYKTNATPSGSQSFILPSDTSVGDHAVSAHFVPRLPNQSPSASATVAWVVTQVRTRLQVRVTGRGVRIPTSVVVAASGEYGTRPTGAVTVTVRHLGTRKPTRRTRTFDAAGTVRARFGILRAGTYRLRVSYAGDGQHLGERRSQRFTVRQR